MSDLPPAAHLANDLAKSEMVPGRALVGIVADHPPEFVISPPLSSVLDGVFGFTAPSSWWGVAIVADVHHGHQLVRTAWMATRDGESVVASCDGREDGEPLGSFAEVVLADTVRLCLGLSTAPPSIPIALLDELCWLDLLVAKAARETLRLDQALALRRHDRPRRRGDPWRHLHHRTTEAASSDCVHRFAWMDTGMFSRWVLGLWPAPDELIATLIDLVEPSIVAGVLARCPLVRARLPEVDTVSA